MKSSRPPFPDDTFSSDQIETKSQKFSEMIQLLAFATYALALASILVTRLLKAFTVAEYLAVIAFLCGLAIGWMHYRRTGTARTDTAKMPWSRRLIVAGSAIGLSGLPLKLLFSLLGIGTAEHDMANHEINQGNPLLLHIHHLFFNLGFLVLLVSLLVMLVTTLHHSGSR
jgi:hypothetical protein